MPAVDYGLVALENNGMYLMAGLVSGFISGLLGLGGGILMTTMLTLKGNLSQHEVIGTSLAAVVPIGLMSSVHNYRHGRVHVPTSVALGASLGAGAYLTSTFITVDISEQGLREFFASMLTFSAVVLLKR